jgi:hypothetical protein
VQICAQQPQGRCWWCPNDGAVMLALVQAVSVNNTASVELDAACLHVLKLRLRVNTNSMQLEACSACCVLQLPVSTWQGCTKSACLLSQCQAVFCQAGWPCRSANQPALWGYVHLPLCCMLTLSWGERVWLLVCVHCACGATPVRGTSKRGCLRAELPRGVLLPCAIYA